MNILLPANVIQMLEKLTEAGHAAYVVGGCVRDSLLGFSPKDWDITTSALPGDVKNIFAHTVDTGLKHGTVTVLLEGSNYEVTTFRIDGEYLDARRPQDVRFTDNINEDLSRRDFTINAMAYHPASGLVDPYGGYADLQRGLVSCVGIANERFTEDALRMMRAVRFCAQLSFAMEEATGAAIPPLAQRLALVSIERVRDELTKILASPQPAKLMLLEELGLWPHVMRDMVFRGSLKAAATRLIELNKKNALSNNAALFALLFAEEGEATEALMWFLRFDKRTINDCSALVSWLPRQISNTRLDVKLALNALGLALFLQLCQLRDAADLALTAEDIQKSGECYTLSGLAVDGKMLISAGVAPGRGMGELLQRLLLAVIEEPGLNEAGVLLRMAATTKTHTY